MNYKLFLYIVLILSAIIKLIFLSKTKEKDFKKFSNLTSVIILIIIFALIFFK